MVRYSLDKDKFSFFKVRITALFRKDKGAITRCFFCVRERSKMHASYSTWHPILSFEFLKLTCKSIFGFICTSLGIRFMDFVTFSCSIVAWVVGALFRLLMSYLLMNEKKKRLFFLGRAFFLSFVFGSSFRIEK